MNLRLDRIGKKNGKMNFRFARIGKEGTRRNEMRCYVEIEMEKKDGMA